jgi:diaminopimelate epimerase
VLSKKFGLKLNNINCTAAVFRIKSHTFVDLLMLLTFSKYQGAGNDFVLVDDRSLTFPAANLSVVQKICHRKYGVGSDGLILIQPDSEADFFMNFFNPDGSQSYCGNGSRCAVHFANSIKAIGNTCTYKAIDGLHHGRILENAWVETSILPVSQIEKIGADFFLNTGSPHYVKFYDDIQNINILEEARKIRDDSRFAPGGTNVNFVKGLNSTSIKMRTYERGVEDETLSCGTGVTAAALAVMKESGVISVETKGGLLQVTATKTKSGFENIKLTGPAEMVFTGTMNLKP